MKRTYRGPIIERKVESGIINTNEYIYCNRSYCLAVDDGTGDIVLIVKVSDIPGHFNVSYYNPVREARRAWTVTR